MTSIAKIRRFYHDLRSCLLVSLRSRCQRIVATPGIDEKIAIGLSLGGLFELYIQLDGRMREIATGEIVGQDEGPCESGSGMAGLYASAIQFRDEIAGRVLFEPEARTIALILQLLPRLIASAGEPGDTPDAQLPVRERTLRYSDTKPFRFQAGKSIIDDDENYLGFLFYVLVDVEISATEICSHMILSNPDMPDEFFIDMARQIWDEARHAAYMRDLFFERGGSYARFTYTNAVIKRYLRAADLLDGLIIQQLLQEGNAVETNVGLSRLLYQAGRTDEAASFLVINNDEALHVKIGSKWIEYLAATLHLGHDYLFDRMLSASRRIEIPLFGTGGWNDTVRSAIGFPPWLLALRRTLLSDQ